MVIDMKLWASGRPLFTLTGVLCASPVGPSELLRVQQS